MALLVYGIYWLWQRQPKPQNHQLSAPAAQEKDKEAFTFEIKPQDNSILASNKFKFEGRSQPDVLIAIYSNSQNDVVKTDSLGKFEKEVQLAIGLNLVEIVIISKDLKAGDKITLTYWVEEFNSQTFGTQVYAGSIKSLLGNLITISTPSGEKNIQASQSVKIELPKDAENESESTKSALQNLRVGDYLIALGDLSGGTLNAQSLKILRKDKPQIIKKISLAKILTSIRQNLSSGRKGLFSAKVIETNEIVEFTLNKNSSVALDDQQGKNENIEKNKNALIVYHPAEDQKLVDLIYLLP